MWAYVTAANNAQPITDARFSNTYFNDGNGNYYLIIGSNTEFWCDAPSYQTTYANSDLNDHMQISLVYLDGWPQTY